MFNPSDILDKIGVGWIGTVIGVLGIGYAIFDHQKNTIVRSISYTMSGRRVVGYARGENEKIKLQYDGVDVPRITRSTVTIWNSGNWMFRGADIVETHPLMIALSDGFVLDASIDNVSREVVQFSLRHDVSTVLVSFDFMDPGDGVTIVLLHTGSELVPELSGTMRGLPKGLSNVQRSLNPASVILRRARTRWLPVPAMFFLLGLGSLLSYLVVESFFGKPAAIFAALLYPCSGVIVVPVLLLMRQYAENPPRKLRARSD